MNEEITDLDEAVRLALTASYGGRIDAAWHADEDGHFRPTSIPDAFELVLAEIEHRGWVYEHASLVIQGSGQRAHSFWIAEPDPTAEYEITNTLAGETEKLSSTRLLAGCLAFVEAVANALPEQEAIPA